MIFNCGPSLEAKRIQKLQELDSRLIQLKDWHKIFAWYPVRLNETACVWLQTIERRCNGARIHDNHVLKGNYHMIYKSIIKGDKMEYRLLP